MTTEAHEVTSSNTFVKSELHRKLEKVGACLEADVLTIIAPMGNSVDDLVRNAVEKIEPKRPKILVLLETNGGSIEVVERIADLLRFHYPSEVSFLIPSHAMSAGTVLAMSGDNIYMDYFSVLGPIDPQIRSRSKGDIWVPALGYVEKYNELISKSAAGLLTSAEIAFLVQKFDPAEIHQIQKARELSIELLKRWLVQFKFKNWVKTRSSNISVTQKMKEERAEDIAANLNNVDRWKTHSRGLSMSVIDRDLNLLIEDFGANQPLNKAVRSYYGLLKDYMAQVQHEIVVHVPKLYVGA